MHINTTLFTTAIVLAGNAAADFLVITEYPDALKSLGPEEASAYISTHLPSLAAQFATDTSYLAAATRVVPQLREFAVTATVSLPPVVTALDDFTVFTSPPAWYTQLPSDVRAFYDDAAKRVEAYVEENPPSGVPANATSVAPSTSASASASHSNSASGRTSMSASASVSASESVAPESTGAAGRVDVRVVGAGVVAGVLGLVVL